MNDNTIMHWRRHSYDHKFAPVKENETVNLILYETYLVFVNCRVESTDRVVLIYRVRKIFGDIFLRAFFLIIMQYVFEVLLVYLNYNFVLEKFLLVFFVYIEPSKWVYYHYRVAEGGN